MSHTKINMLCIVGAAIGVSAVFANELHLSEAVENGFRTTSRSR